MIEPLIKNHLTSLNPKSLSLSLPSLLFKKKQKKKKNKFCLQHAIVPFY